MLERETQPFSFKDIVGNHITVSELMERSLKLDFPEVMLFEGPSGCGKTTTAYIVAALLAKDNSIEDEVMDLNSDGSPRINEHGVENVIKFRSPKPDTAASLDVRNQRWGRDVSFYNAASLGKDGILALEEKMAYAPLQDGHRTIILDEAQEISKAGKGAALALLEKKRRDTTIILCTMDISAFDRAVKDRARVYSFRPPEPIDIARYLSRIITDSPIDFNGIDIPESFFGEGLLGIGEAAQGSVRAAVGMLDRALSARLWDVDLLQKELGIVTPKVAGNLLDALYKKSSRAVEILEGLNGIEAFTTIRRQVLAIRRTQIVGEPADERDAAVCNLHKNHNEQTEALLRMIRRLEDRKYLSDDVVLEEVFEYLRPTEVALAKPAATAAPASAPQEMRRPARRE